MSEIKKKIVKKKLQTTTTIGARPVVRKKLSPINGQYIMPKKLSIGKAPTKPVVAHTIQPTLPPPPKMLGSVTESLIDNCIAKWPILKEFVLEAPQPQAQRAYPPVYDPQAWDAQLNAVVPSTEIGNFYSVDMPSSYSITSTLPILDGSDKNMLVKIPTSKIYNEYLYTRIPKSGEFNAKSAKRFAELAANPNNRFDIKTLPMSKVNINLVTKITDPRIKLLTVLAGMYEIKFGCDPEFFALNPKYAPSAGNQAANHWSQWEPDGYAWEYHNTPARCLNNLLASFNVATEFPFQLSLNARLDLTPDWVDAVPDKQKELGCNPSENVYGFEGNLGMAREIPARWAGGHIHFGLPTSLITPKIITQSVRNLDAILGPALVSMVGMYDDTQRRQFYGLVGEYRTKPYGFEYRTPSNQIWTNSLLMYAAGEIARFCVKLALAGLTWQDIGMDTTEQEYIQVTQDNNVELARAMVHRNMALYWAMFAAKSTFAPDSWAPMSILLREDLTKTVPYHIDSRRKTNKLFDSFYGRPTISPLRMPIPPEYREVTKL